MEGAGDLGIGVTSDCLVWNNFGTSLGAHARRTWNPQKAVESCLLERVQVPVFDACDVYIHIYIYI